MDKALTREDEAAKLFGEEEDNRRTTPGHRVKCLCVAAEHQEDKRIQDSPMTALMNGICQCTPIPFLQNVFLVDEFAAISWQQINLLLQLPDKWLMCALQCARFFQFHADSIAPINPCLFTPRPLAPPRGDWTV